MPTDDPQALTSTTPPRNGRRPPLLSEEARGRALRLIGVPSAEDRAVAEAIHGQIALAEPSSEGLFQLVDALRRSYADGRVPARAAHLHDPSPIYTSALLRPFARIDPAIVLPGLCRLPYLSGARALHVRHVEFANRTRSFRAIELSAEIPGGEVALAIERFDDQGQHDADGVSALGRIAARVADLPGGPGLPMVFWDTESHWLAQRSGLCQGRETFGPVEELWSLGSARFTGGVSGSTIGDGFIWGRGASGVQQLDDGGRRLVAFHGRLRALDLHLPGFWLWQEGPATTSRPMTAALRRYVEQIGRNGPPLGPLQLHWFTAQVGRTETAATPGRNHLMFEQYMTLPVLAGAFLHSGPPAAGTLTP